MKVFLDVGAHTGETLRAVRDPKYGFGRIFCFEPSAASREELARIHDRRVAICPFGLWNETGEHLLHDSGSLGASLFADKFRTQRPGERARFVRATEWFQANLDQDDEIYLKLNCEGAEFDIVEDLLDSGELANVRSVMIDPDVRKIPSQAHREHEVVERLREAGLANYVFEQDVMIGTTHRERIQNWLRRAGAETPSLAVLARQAAFVILEASRGYGEPLRQALRH